MPTEHEAGRSAATHAAPSPAAGRGPGYELRDTDVRAVAIFGVCLAVFCLVVMIGLWVELKALSGDQPEPPSPFKPPDVVIDQRIQLQARERTALDGGYGWSTETKGAVRIPIDEAIKLVAERGIPVLSKTPRTEVDINGHAGKPVAPVEPKP